MDLPTLDFISHSPEQTQRVGRRLGQHARGGDIVYLSGDFGVGKTLFTQGLAAGLGVRERVTSPSFTLITEYAGCDATNQPVTLYHVDLYRVTDAAAVASLGLEEYLGVPDAICAIEWPEHLGAYDTGERLLVTIGMVNETKRRLTFTPRGARYAALLGEIKAEAFGVGP